MKFRVALNPAIGIVLGTSLLLGTAWAQKVQNGVPEAFAKKYPKLVTNKHFRQGLLGYERQVSGGNEATIPHGQLAKAAQVSAANALRPPQIIQGASTPTPNRWASLGPAPELNGQIGTGSVAGRNVSGRTAAIAVDPTNTAHWYIGAASGGIWETTDSGATWISRTDNQASLDMGAIAIASGNPKLIYAGTGEGNFSGDSFAGQGMLKSTDGGGSWTLIGTAQFAKNSFNGLVASSDGNTLLAATNRGFAGFGGFYSPPNPPSAGIWRSTDGGNTWTQKIVGQGTGVAVDPTNFNNQYVAIGDMFGDSANGIYRSTDAGNTWTVVNGPWTGGNVGRIAIAIAPSNPNVMYVGIGSSQSGANFGSLLGLWSTANAFSGAPPAFSAINTSATGSTGYCGWNAAYMAVANQCWYGNVLSVDPTNSSILYAGGIQLWKFNGSTWTEVSNHTTSPANGIHGDMHALVWAGTSTLIAGDDGGVWHTTDGGMTWSVDNTFRSTIQSYYGSVNPGAGGFLVTEGSQDNGTAKTTSAGFASWPYVWCGDGAGTAIGNSTNFALSCQDNLIVRTTNGGTSVVNGNGGIGGTLSFAGRVTKCPSNDNVMLTGNSNLWKTTTFFTAANPAAAGTWTQNNPTTFTGGNIPAIAFAASDATCNTYAFGTDNTFQSGTVAGNIQGTGNGGASWFAIPPGTLPGSGTRGITALAFDPNNANTLYVVYNGYSGLTPNAHVFKTTNALSGAPTWTDVSTPVDIPHDAVLVDGSGNVYAGTDQGVWKSTNGGASWSQMGPATGMPNVAVFDLQQGNGSIVAFTHGRGAFLLTSYDLNNDGIVDCNDYNIVKANIGKRNGVAGFNPLADLNNDGQGNVVDLAIISRQVGACP
jgi:photosystem II stability/assembly factor-like uncharacterized protein